MGKTKTIEDKEKADTAFREFMNRVEKEAEAEETRVYGRIKDLVERHYKENGWKHARLFGDQRSDYQNYDDWSLDRVATIVQRIGDALADKAYPSKEVPGSESAGESAIDTAKEFAGAFAGDYTLIIKRVIGMMSAILTQFASSSVASRNEVLRDTPLAGGLHLFFGCTGKVYEESGFFTHQFIGSFQIVFESHVSAEEARAIALQQILKTTELELQILNEMITATRLAQAKELKELMRNPELWKSTKATYDEMLASVKASRAELVAEYDKYKSVTDAVDAHLDVLDLTEYGRPVPADGGVPLEHLFIDGWELQLAQRYVTEKLAS